MNVFHNVKASCSAIRTLNQRLRPYMCCPPSDQTLKQRPYRVTVHALLSTAPCSSVLKLAHFPLVISIVYIVMLTRGVQVHLLSLGSSQGQFGDWGLGSCPCDRNGVGLNPRTAGGTSEVPLSNGLYPLTAP